MSMKFGAMKKLLKITWAVTKYIVIESNVYAEFNDCQKQKKNLRYKIFK